MYIVPLSGITPLNIMSQIQKTEDITANQPSFTDVFKEAFKNVEETQNTVAEDNIKVSMGEIDDLHTISINAEKAETALQTFVALKNTAVDAYKEVMSISI